MLLAVLGRRLHVDRKSTGDLMFTRSTQAEPQPLEPTKSNGNAARSPVQQRPRPSASEGGPKSVIGNDLRIIGQGLKIISQGTLQVDGEIHMSLAIEQGAEFDGRCRRSADPAELKVDLGS